ncbi:hypothetical protein [Nannocystis sp.]|uniref:hypothetical protein n=1 Tax=Nannocystis sp. TaxID=1962667 RepID=UPI0024228E65|nr:hypothetical protein [Nannocystis sp.]MBK7825329.1 hypothetical protein [Nannocystis sp.]MBK9756980.1 hypothetical protein [Nannocystis sp.]
MHRPLRFVLATSLAATACVRDNPAFDSNGDQGSASATSTTSAVTTTATSAAATTATPTTSTSAGSADASSGAVSNADASASDGSSTAPLTTTGTGDISTTTATTGAPEPMTHELKHYPDLAQCDFPFWCVFGDDINNPSSAENWDAECFASPIAPPFTVSRVGFAVFGTKGGPSATLDFHEYDNNTSHPVMAPFQSVNIGVIDSTGYKSFPIDPPVVVNVQRFCISVHSGQQFGPELGIAVDDVLAPAGQTFVGIKGPPGCNINTFTDLTTVNSSTKTQWCIDATIAEVP